MTWTLQQIWYQTVRHISRTAITFGFSLKSEGHENIPRTGPFLLLANHASYLDPPTIGCCVVRPIFYLARSTLWKNPLFGSLLTSINSVPVNQSGPAHEGLKTVITKLQQGQGVILFPEGTRSENGNMNPLQAGILLILRRLEFSFPVIPVGIGGSYRTWPLHQRLPYLSPLFLPPARRGPMAVSFGKPVQSEQYRGLEKAEILGDLHARIHAQWQRAELMNRKPLD